MTVNPIAEAVNEAASLDGKVRVIQHGFDLWLEADFAHQPKDLRLALARLDWAGWAAKAEGDDDPELTDDGMGVRIRFEYVAEFDGFLA